MSKLTNRITAMLLSGMLVVGSATGSVYAAAADVDPGLTSEIAEEVFTEEPVETSEAPAESAQTSEVAEEVFPEEWTAENTEVPVNPDQIPEAAPLEEAVTSYTVTLDANGGYFTNEWDDSIGDYVEQAEMVEKQIPVGGTMTAVPMRTEQNGQSMIFGGWSLERDGELVSTGDEEYAPVGNCVLYAVWQIDEIETEAAQESGDPETTEGAETTDIKENRSEESEEGGNETADDDHAAPGASADALDDTTVVESQPETGAEENTGKTGAKDSEEQKKSGADNVLETSDPKETDSPGHYDVSPDDDPSTDTASASEEYEDPEDDVQDLPVIITDDAETETVTTDSANSDAGNIIRSGECAGDVIWVLTGTNPDSEDRDLTLTISGTEDIMPAFSNPDWTLYNSVIGKVVIENGITGIGPETFSGFKSLETITIPSTVTKIGREAFYECSKLENITIPDGVTSIGESAFRACRSLTSITIPDRVKSIESNTFYECRSLTSVTLPDSVTSFGECIFERCSSLTSVTIPDGVTRIGDYTLYDCSSLTSVTLPDSVTSIGYKAFDFCSSLTSITIPDNVTSIGEWAFSNCSSLTSLTIPDGVTRIGDNTFYGCSILTNVRIPDSVTSIGNSAFLDCGITNVTIPDGVTRIGDKAFGSCNILKSISIPNSVTIIGAEAFINCNRLTSVTIPDGVTNIFSNTFYECSSLTSVTIPDSVTSIGFQAFYKCSSLASMTIPDNVDSIDKYAFYNCSSLTSVTIPGGVTSIGESAFSGCSSLTSLTISDGVKGIGNQAFYLCSSLTSVTIPGSVTSIGESAFQGCSSLTSLEISDSVNCIGKAAFSYCSSLTSVTIPDSVTTIGEDAFSGCTSLTKAVIPFSVTSIGKYAFYQRDSHFPSSNNPIENLTIYGYTGSYAEQYANENGIPFIAIDGMSWIDDFGIPHYYTIALQATSTGRFVTCDVGAKDDKGRYTKMDNPDLNVDATEIKAYEKFELVPCSDGSYALRSVMNRKFITFYFSQTLNSYGTVERINEGFECGSDFVNETPITFEGNNDITITEPFVKLILTPQEDGMIKFKNCNRWLCVNSGKLCVTDNENEAGVFRQILVDDNHYTDKELKILSEDEWFDLSLQNKENLGYYNIQWDVGQYTAHNATTLRNLGYTIMNEDGHFGRDYVEIDNMQCFVAYKKVKERYEVIIDFQGTGGYGDDDKAADAISNITGNLITSIFSPTYTNESGLHKGYYDMAKKLIDNGIYIHDYADSVNLEELICMAEDENRYAHFTVLGHSMGGAIAQCYALYLANERSIPKSQITGRTFNSALACNFDDDGFKDWYNLCVSTDSVSNGLVPGSIIYYGMHRIGKTIWLYDNKPDDNDPIKDLNINISNNKHVMDEYACLYTILHNIWESHRCEHDWGTGNTIAVATQEKDGEKFYTCPKCGREKTEILHSFGSFEVTGLKSKTYTGKAITQTPVLKKDNVTLERNVDYVVSFKNNINAGTATVTITGKGDYSGTITKTFKINKAAQSITASNLSLTYPNSGTITASGNQGKLTYKSDNTAIATVDSTGKVTAKGAGNAKITITAAATSNYKSATKTITVTIAKAAQSITVKAAASSIAVGNTTTVSTTGNKGAVTYKSADTTIAAVTKSTGKVTAKKVGTVKITATSAATANYNATSKTVTIKVVPAATASLKADNQATGIKLTWKKVTGANGYKVYRGSTLIKTITNGSTVTFADTKANTNGTKYTYKVVAKAATGDSTLSKSVAVYRVARPAVSSVANSAAGKMTVKWGKNTKATGYQIQYSIDKTFKTGNKAVTVAGASAVSKVIRGLTKSKTYYVRIRTYKTVGSAKYWSVWSAAKSVKIAK